MSEEEMSRVEYKGGSKMRECLELSMKKGSKRRKCLE